MKINWRMIKNNKRLLKIMLLISIILILVLITFSTTRVINKINNERQQQEIVEFEWKTTRSTRKYRNCINHI